AHAQSAEVVIVVSAMQGETNRLLELAKKSHNPLVPNREFDQIMATGEIVSASLMALALESLGLKAMSMTGKQAGIQTTDLHQDASIQEIQVDHIKQLIEQGIVPVVTGFQGYCGQHVTTLGRGGSDLTAVALAHALDAENCWIYTDVKGVHAIDPNVVPNDDVFEQIGYENMMQMAFAGAEVIQYAAIDYANRYQVPLRVCSTFEPGIGTLINQSRAFDKPIIVKSSGLTKLSFQKDNQDTYEDLFANNILYSSESCHLLNMLLPEIKTKLKLVNLSGAIEDILPNQTLVTVFLPSQAWYKVFFDTLSEILYATTMVSKENNYVLRVLVPDYKMTFVLTNLYQMTQVSLERAVND
ncbi:MAG: hypothetical protein P8L77_00325, partial [Gammaproteobacteria bacterium]|nr:hypothetical protein [Gammaproteobacteria bacterium]